MCRYIRVSFKTDRAQSIQHDWSSRWAFRFNRRQYPSHLPADMRPSRRSIAGDANARSGALNGMPRAISFADGVESRHSAKTERWSPHSRWACVEQPSRAERAGVGEVVAVGEGEGGEFIK